MMHYDFDLIGWIYIGTGLALIIWSEYISTKIREWFDGL